MGDGCVLSSTHALFQSLALSLCLSFAFIADVLFRFARVGIVKEFIFEFARMT